MNRKLAVFMIALPLGAIALPRVASAAEYSPQAQVIAQLDDHRFDRATQIDQHAELQREQARRAELQREQARRVELQREQARRENDRRVWIPGHWQPGFLGIGRRWVAGHWETR